ncbi:MAG: DAK2 domain-containing protein [Clostridia bacterium]|nr:DAK2 domain-containing protein [Clostridia bacterium]
MLTGLQYAKMIISGANNLINQKELLNEMNVFPVPDGDTGKNMSMSISGAKKVAEDILDGQTDIGNVADKVAMATLRGARGNSGVILSQLLRGFAKEMKGKKSIDAKTFAKCFSIASQTAYSAVMKPTEGTILTVARQSSEAVAEFAKTSDDILEIMKKAVKSANISLSHTPDLLPKLKAAGVVDAGGKGWVVLLEGMLFFLEKGEILPLEESTTLADTSKLETTANEEITFTYCTEFLIDKSSPDVNVDIFKNTISKIGDCMVVIDDFDIVKVHIHTDNPGVVIQNALKIGSLNDIKIDNMRYQHNEKIIKKPEVEITKEPKKEYGIISVSAGEGYSSIMKELGVNHIIEGGQTMNPSAGDILEAIEKVNAKVIYLLPNNKNIILAAEAARDMAEDKVVIIGTSSVPQGISALLAFNNNSSWEENEKSMKEAFGLVSDGSVTYAVRDSENNGVVIKKDDVIALNKSGVIASGKDINEIAFELCKSLINEDAGLVTIYYGQDIKEEDAENLAEKVEAEFSDLDVSVQFGGQPIYYYNIAVE